MKILELNLPASTRVQRVIPKTAFYRHTQANSRLRDLFAQEIERIVLMSAIRSDTLNVEAGIWKEISVFSIELKSDYSQLSPELLKVMDSAMPRPALFAINAGDFWQLAMSYKEKDPKRNSVKIVRTFVSNWQKDFDLDFSGLSVDAIYAGLIKQISGRNFQPDLETVKLNVEKIAQENEIKKKIAKLQKSYQKELSLAKRQAIAREIHELEEKC